MYANELTKSVFANQNLKTLKQISKESKMMPVFSGEKFLFSFYEAISFMKYNSIVKWEKIKSKIAEQCQKNQEKATWQRLATDFTPLNKNKEFIDFYIKNPESSVFYSFVLNMVSYVWNFRIKIWQRNQKLTVSCSIGNHKGVKKLNLLLIPSDKGIQFCFLEK